MLYENDINAIKEYLIRSIDVKRSNDECMICLSDNAQYCN